MLITLTQKHIDKGQPGACGKCPVALAFHDAGFPDANVGHKAVWASCEERLASKRPLCYLPNQARWFIAYVDNGLPVAPFTFEVELRRQTPKEGK